MFYPSISGAVAQDAKGLLRNYRVYAERFQKIKDRDGGRMVPMRLKPVQQRMDEAVDAAHADHRPALLQVTKSRRLGTSSYVASKFLHRCCTRRYQHAVVMADVGPNAKKIFLIYEWMYEHLPPQIRPLKAGSKGQQINLVKLYSQIDVGSAESLTFGRGGDVQLCHLSEAAYYKDPQSLLSAILPGISARGDGILILESTAAGPGSWWHDLWQRSLDGTSRFTPMFFAWFEDPDHWLPDAVPDESFTDEERGWVASYGVTGHQIAWLRWRQDVDCQGRDDRRRREYPSSAAESFSAVGEVAWTMETLLTCYRRQAPEAVGNITERGFQPYPEGPLMIWEHPMEGALYVIGADPAGGLKDNDNCAAEVWRVGRKPGEWPIQVAEWVGHEDPMTFAKTLTMLGTYYRRALLACEVTGVGRGCQAALQKTFHYPRLHRWIRWDAYKSKSDTYGWECLDPEALVLMGDLRWVPARQVKVGDEVLGCEEQLPAGRGHKPHLRRQRVSAREIFVAPMMEIALENGQRTRVSTTHPFWLGDKRKTGWRWVPASHVRPGDHVKYLAPWREVRSYEAGRLSGLLDGEGHLYRRHGGKYGMDLLVSQNAGELADDILDLWGLLGFQAGTRALCHRQRPHEEVLTTSGVRRVPDVLRALGSLRPIRLLRKFAAFDLVGCSLQSLATVRVASVTPIGEGPVVGLTTEPDHTLIADGIVGHNTTPQSKAVMIGMADWLIRTGHVVIRSPYLLNEFVHFQEVSPGTYECVTGDGHGDRLMACVPAGTPITVEGGTMPIDAIQVGNRVLTHRGRVRMVTGTASRPVTDALVQLRAMGMAQPVTMTAEHLVWRAPRPGPALWRGNHATRRRIESDELTGGWCPAGALVRGDYVFVPRRVGLPPSDLSPEWLYVLGWYLSDGSCALGKGLRIVFGPTEYQVARRVGAIVQQMVAGHPTTWYAGRGATRGLGKRERPSKVVLRDMGRYFRLHVHNQWLTDLIGRICGFSGDKGLRPAFYHRSGLAPLVVGFLEGDGHQTKRQGHIQMSQKNAQVFHQMRQILLDLGIWCTSGRVNRNGCEVLNLGAESVNRLLAMYPSSRFSFVDLLHPTRRTFMTPEGFWTPIRAVSRRRADTTMVYDIEVDDDQSFVAGGVAVHNSMIAWTSWLQHLYQGVNMKDLRATLSRIYGGTSAAETVKERSEKAARLWTPEDGEPMIGEYEMEAMGPKEPSDLSRAFNSPYTRRAARGDW